MHESTFDARLGIGARKEVAVMDVRAGIAETYLRMIPNDTGHRHDGTYVRLAAKYGVPFGRIVNLTGLSADVVGAHLEGKD